MDNQMGNQIKLFKIETTVDRPSQQSN